MTTSDPRLKPAQEAIVKAPQALVEVTDVFAPQGKIEDVPLGINVAQIVKYVLRIELGEQKVLVWIQGELIPEDMWTMVYPKLNANVHVKIIPTDDSISNDNIFRIVIFIAVIYFSGGYGASFGAYLAPGASAGAQAAIGGALITTLGVLAINTLFPFPTPDGGPAALARERTLFIEGARNDVRPFEPVPVVLGTHRLVPPLAALNYTRVDFDRDPLNNRATSEGYNIALQLFCLGLGNITYRDERIGASDFYDFRDARLQSLISGKDEDYVYGRDTYQETLSIQLLASNKLDADVRTSASDTVFLTIDIVFPNGLVFINDQNDPKQTSVFFLIEYRAIIFDAVTGIRKSSGPWFIDRPYPRQNNPRQVTNSDHTIHHEIRSNSLKAVRRTVDVSVRAAREASRRIKGDLSEVWDVRVTRINEDNIDVIAGDDSSKGRIRERDAKLINDSWWTAIRTLQGREPVILDGTNLAALRIRATEQLNGVVDSFNVLASNEIPTYKNITGLRNITAPNNGQTHYWMDDPRLTFTDDQVRTIPSSNPAAISKYILQGHSKLTGVPYIDPITAIISDDRIDFDSLNAWYEFCEAEGFEYNKIITKRISVRSLLVEIAAAGRASVGLRHGRWSWIMDANQETISQHFTPSNTWNFSTSHTYPEPLHALKCTFSNQVNDYLTEEMIVYADGFNSANATKFEDYRFQGITKPDLIFTHAREIFAQIKLRPRQMSFDMDPEYLAAQRGSRCKLTNETLGIGLGSGRISHIDKNNLGVIFVDFPLSIGEATNLSLRIRTFTGESYLFSCRMNNTDNPNLGWTRLVVSLSSSRNRRLFAEVKEDDLVMVGFTNAESIDVIIKDIIPSDDYTATIVVQDYAPAIFTARRLPIPEFTSGVRVPAQFQRLSVPRVRYSESDARVQVAGSIGVRVVLHMVPITSTDVEVEVRQRSRNNISGGFTRSRLLDSNPTTVIILELEEGAKYDFRILYKRVGQSGLLNNVYSPTAFIINLLVEGNEG